MAIERMNGFVLAGRKIKVSSASRASVPPQFHQQAAAAAAGGDVAQRPVLQHSIP